MRGVAQWEFLTGFGTTASSPEQAFAQIAAWKESPSLRILHDTEDCLETLSELALAGRVCGAMIHDARTAACCLSHTTQELWTVDRDFSRFPDLRTRNPLA